MARVIIIFKCLKPPTYTVLLQYHDFFELFYFV